jgi:hypothetical protein
MDTYRIVEIRTKTNSTWGVVLTDSHGAEALDASSLYDTPGKAQAVADRLNPLATAKRA